MRVTVRNNNIDRALSTFKRKCSDVVMDVRSRQAYEKPTTVRGRAKKLAQIRERKRKANDRKPA